MATTYHFRIRRDTSAAWATNNPVLQEGEPGYETDTKRLRIGDGVNPFTALTTVNMSGGESGGGDLNAEAVRDIVQQQIVGGNLIQVTVSDEADTITITTTAHQRSNHQGSQAISTVTGLQTALDDRVTQSELDTALGGYADVDQTSGTVSIDVIPKSQSGTASSMVQRNADGTITTVGATGTGSADKVVVKSQLDSAIAGVATTAGGAVVSEFVLGSDLTSTSSTTTTAMTDLRLNTAATGQVITCSYLMVAEAGVTGGGWLGFTAPTGSSGTNLLPAEDASFEGGTIGTWQNTSSHTLAPYTGDGQHGTHCMTITAVTTANAIPFNSWITVAPGDVISASGYAKYVTGTPKVCRVDIQYEDTLGATSSQNGPNVTPSATAWTRIVKDATTNGAFTIPAGVTKARVRFVVTTPAIGDVVRVDAFKIEKAATHTAFDITVGATASPTNGITLADYSILGGWRVSALAPTLASGSVSASESYTRAKPVVYGSTINANTTTQAEHSIMFGGFGANVPILIEGNFIVRIVGASITAGLIQPEFRMRVDEASASVKFRANQARAIYSRLATV